MSDQIPFDFPTRRYPPLFDAAAGEAIKQRVLAHIEEGHQEWLEIARAAAVEIATLTGDVTGDKLAAVLFPLGLYPSHHNAMGGVFRGEPRLEWTGERRKSAIPDHHRNYQMVWRLRRNPDE